jgi:serine/threonine protein kinase
MASTPHPDPAPATPPAGGDRSAVPAPATPDGRTEPIIPDPAGLSGTPRDPTDKGAGPDSTPEGALDDGLVRDLVHGLNDTLDGETRVMSRVRETFIGPYQVDVKLGDGGMGNVYKALDPKLGRNVAIKVIKDELAFNERYLERLGREARTLASLSHPALIQIYAFEDGKEDPCTPPYLVMEFVDGQSLEALLRRKKRLELPLALRLAREAVQGLAAALEQGIIHRDIKPSNLLISNEGRLKIVDFGLAKEVESSVSITSEGIVLGTPEYISPEQAQGENADHRCDIYSLGCTLYHMLTGRPVFPEKTQAKMLYAHIYAAPVLPHRVNRNLPVACSQVLGKMLAKDPDNRYATYAELAEDLECLEFGKAPAKTVREAARRTYRGPGARTLRFWLGTAASIIAVFLLGIFFAQLMPKSSGVASARSKLEPFLTSTSDGSDRVEIAFPFDKMENSSVDPIQEFFITKPGTRTRPQVIKELVWKDYKHPLAFRFALGSISEINLGKVNFPNGPGEFAVAIQDPQSANLRQLEFVFPSGRYIESPIKASSRGNPVLSENPPDPLPRLRGVHDIRIGLTTDHAARVTFITLNVYSSSASGPVQIYPPSNSDNERVALPGTLWADGLLVLTTASCTSQMSISMNSLQVVAAISDQEIYDVPIANRVAERLVP